MMSGPSAEEKEPPLVRPGAPLGGEIGSIAWKVLLKRDDCRSCPLEEPVEEPELALLKTVSEAFLLDPRPPPGDCRMNSTWRGGSFGLFCFPCKSARASSAAVDVRKRAMAVR